MGWLSVKDDTDLPESPGCYAAFLDGRLVYVGSSTNIRKRVMAQRAKLEFWGRSIRLALIRFRIYRRTGEFLAAEYRLIKKLRPPFNKVHNGNGGYVPKRKYTKRGAALPLPLFRGTSQGEPETALSAYQRRRDGIVARRGRPTGPHSDVAKRVCGLCLGESVVLEATTLSEAGAIRMAANYWSRKLARKIVSSRVGQTSFRVYREA